MDNTPPWMTWPSVQNLFAIFASADVPLYAVGGCVRDAVLGRTPKDVDFATAAPPNRTMELLRAASVRAVPTGLEHGTVTAVFDGAAHEITTFRSDVETDGRHAMVAFTDDRKTDAQRRDFTMNALYMDANGVIYDDVGGIEDAQAGRVRFIGDANARIAEDYLRILRYFRFCARYARVPPEEPALKAISDAAQGLSRVSSERIGQEIVQLFETDQPLKSIQTMQDTGIAQVIFNEFDFRALTRAIEGETALNLVPHPMMRLAVYSPDPLKEKLRLSNVRAKESDAIQALRTTAEEPVILGHEWPASLAIYGLVAMRAFQNDLVSDQDLLDLQFGQDSSCPIKASDFAGFYQGPA